MYCNIGGSGRMYFQGLVVFEKEILTKFCLITVQTKKFKWFP